MSQLMRLLGCFRQRNHFVPGGGGEVRGLYETVHHQIINGNDSQE